VLLIWATRDLLSPLGVARQLVEQLPNARLVSIDSDHHWVARAQAPDTARAIHDFLLESAPSAPR